MKQKSAPIVSGTVTHPSDLGPAIRSLGVDGQSLIQWCEKAFGKVTPKMVANAADYERGHTYG